MWFKISFTIFLLVIFCSCSSKVLLYHGEKKEESQLSTLKIARPTASITEPSTIARGYIPSGRQKIWVDSINDTSISIFITSGRNPQTPKIYLLLPGKNQ